MRSGVHRIITTGCQRKENPRKLCKLVPNVTPESFAEHEIDHDEWSATGVDVLNKLTSAVGHHRTPPYGGPNCPLPCGGRIATPPRRSNLNT